MIDITDGKTGQSLFAFGPGTIDDVEMTPTLLAEAPLTKAVMDFVASCFRTAFTSLQTSRCLDMIKKSPEAPQKVKDDVLKVNTLVGADALEKTGVLVKVSQHLAQETGADIPIDTLLNICKRMSVPVLGEHLDFELEQVVAPSCTVTPTIQDIISILEALGFVSNAAQLIAYIQNTHMIESSMEGMLQDLTIDPILKRALLQLGKNIRAAKGALIELATTLTRGVETFWPVAQVAVWLDYAERFCAIAKGFAFDALQQKILDYAEHLEGMLPNVDAYCNSTTFFITQAKKQLLKQDKRKQIADEDTALDAALETIATDFDAVMGTDVDLLTECPLIERANMVCLTSHKIVEITALVSLLSEKPSTSNIEEINFVLEMSTGLPQPLIDYAKKRVGDLNAALSAAPPAKKARKRT